MIFSGDWCLTGCFAIFFASIECDDAGSVPAFAIRVKTLWLGSASMS